MSLIITGCESDKSHLKDESVDKSSENMLIENKFASVDELAEFMIENKNGDFNSLFSSSQPKSSEFTVYALKNLPDNYNLYDVTQNGSFISFDYLNDEAEKYEVSENNNKLSNKVDIENDVSIAYDSESSYYDESSEENLNKLSENSNISKMTFVWGYNTEGDIYLKNAIEMFELTEMPNMPNFYYSEACDDYGVNIYQIYWSQDGYCFQLNIPTEMFNNPETYGLKKSKSENKSDFMELEKIKYTLPAD